MGNLNPIGTHHKAICCSSAEGRTIELLLADKSIVKGQLMTYGMAFAEEKLCFNRKTIRRGEWDKRARVKCAKMCAVKAKQAVLMCPSQKVQCVVSLRFAFVARPDLRKRAQGSKKKKCCNFSYREIQFLKKSMCRCFHFPFLCTFFLLLRRKTTKISFAFQMMMRIFFTPSMLNVLRDPRNKKFSSLHMKTSSSF